MTLHDRLFELYADVAGGAGHGQSTILASVRQLLVQVVEHHEVDRATDLMRIAEGIALRAVVDGIASGQPDQRLLEQTRFWSQLSEDPELEAFTTLLLWAGGLQTPPCTSGRTASWWIERDPSLARIGLVLLFAAGQGADSCIVQELAAGVEAICSEGVAEPVEGRRRLFAHINYLLERAACRPDDQRQRPDWLAFLQWGARSLRPSAAEDLPEWEEDRQAWGAALETVPTEARQLRWDLPTLDALVDCLCAVDGEHDALQLIRGALLVAPGWQPLVRLLDAEPEPRSLRSWVETLRGDYALERLGGAGWAVLLDALAQRDLMAPVAFWIAQLGALRPEQAGPLLQLALESMAAVSSERMRRLEGRFCSLHALLTDLVEGASRGAAEGGADPAGTRLAQELAQLMRERPSGWRPEMAELAGQVLMVGLDNRWLSWERLTQDSSRYRPLPGLAALVSQRGGLERLNPDDLVDPALAHLAMDLDRQPEPLRVFCRPCPRHTLLQIALLAKGRLLQAQLRAHQRTWEELASLLAIPAQSSVLARALECSLAALLDAIEQSPDLLQADRYLAELVHALPDEAEPALLIRIQTLPTGVAQETTRRLLRKMLDGDSPRSTPLVVQRVLLPWLESDRTEWSLEMLKVLSRIGMPQTLASVIASPRLPVTALRDMLCEWILYPAEPLQAAALDALSLRFEACLTLWKGTSASRPEQEVGETLAGILVLLALSLAESSAVDPQEATLRELMQRSIDQLHELPQALRARLPIFEPAFRSMLTNSYRVGALAGDQVQTVRNLIAALRLEPFDAARMVWECPAPARLNAASIRLVSCLVEISGATSWSVIYPWLAQSASLANLEQIPFLSRRAVVMGMQLLQLDCPHGPARSFLDLLASQDPLDLGLLFTSSALPAWARQSVVRWLLSKGPLSGDQGLHRWLADLRAVDPVMSESAQLSAVAALAVLFPERGLRQLQQEGLAETLIQDNRPLELYGLARGLVPAATEWQVTLRLARLLAACYRHEPIAEGLWSGQPDLALWVWIAQAGMAHTGGPLGGAQGVLHPAQRVARLQPQNLMARVARFNPPASQTGREIVEALRRRDPTRILAVVLKPQEVILRDFGDCAESAVGAIWLLHAFSLEDWTRLRDLPQALRTAQYGAVLALDNAHRRRLDTLLKALQSLRQMRPAVGAVLDQALGTVPIFHDTRWLPLRAAARHNSQGSADPLASSARPPAWVGLCLQRALAGEDLDLGGDRRDRMVDWSLRDLEMEPAARLSESPHQWAQSDLQEKWEDLQQQWTALLFEEEPPACWAQTLRSFSTLLFDPQAPRFHRAAESFKHDWLTRLRRAIPPIESLSAPQKSELLALLSSGLADLDPMVCSAGWDQLVNSWLEALGAPEELDTALRYSLGRSLRAQMIRVLGTLIGRPQDAHLKNRVNAACHPWPSERSVGGLSPELLESSWQDVFPLQDHPEARPRLLCRLPQAPALPHDQVPPGVSDYDRRVVHLIRSELPRIFSPTERLELVLRQILLLPEQSDGVDLRTVSRRVAEWLHPEEEQRQYETAQMLFQSLRQAQYDRKRPSEGLLMLTMATGAALGLWRLTEEMPPPRAPEGV